MRFPQPLAALSVVPRAGPVVVGLWPPPAAAACQPMQTRLRPVLHVTAGMSC
jgi:hypothetical protein